MLGSFNKPEVYKIGRLYINLKPIRDRLKENAKSLDIDYVEAKFNRVA